MFCLHPLCVFSVSVCVWLLQNWDKWVQIVNAMIAKK